MTLLNSITEISIDAFQSCQNIVIKGYKNSYVEKYAYNNKIPFICISDIKGDINGDGMLTCSDLVALLNIFFKTDIIDINADINLDGKINIVDFILLKHKLLQ